MSDPRGSYLESYGNDVFYWTRVAGAPRRWTRLRGSGNTTPWLRIPQVKRSRPTPAGRRANHVKLVLAGMMAVGTLMSAGPV